ncbi:MAG: substrate-binding domain-containing protein [Acidobacteriota bacterium]
MASTTSARNSGLFDDLLPRFTDATGIEVRVVAVGTGQAIRLAERGDADVLLVHHRPSEDRFMAEGHGAERRDLMHNSFVLIGDRSDPAQVEGHDIIEALVRIARQKTLFVSRGDQSGTHRKELALWAEADIDARAASGTWYREAGAGMGATLGITVGLHAYTLTDRASWLNFDHKDRLRILVTGDTRLFNPYGVILVNPGRHPHVKAAEGRRFLDWLTSPEGQLAIANYRIHGEQVFFPDAPGRAPGD